MPLNTLADFRPLSTLLLFVFFVSCTNTGGLDQSPAQSANSSTHADVVITAATDLDEHVGQSVVIRGELKRLKVASVLGVDLSFNDIASEDMFGKQVECTGKLTREVVANAPPEASRGDGVYYALIDVSDDDPVTVTVIE